MPKVIHVTFVHTDINTIIPEIFDDAMPNVKIITYLFRNKYERIYDFDKKYCADIPALMHIKHRVTDDPALIGLTGGNLYYKKWMKYNQKYLLLKMIIEKC